MPSSTYRADAFLAAAELLGVEVVVATDAPPPSARSAMRLELSDPLAVAAAISEWDRRQPVDAVVAVDDQGVAAAAAASRRLGLRHAPPEAVAAAQDKLRTRQRLAAAEVPQPPFRAADPDDPDDLRSAAAAVGFPCVVKPTRLNASRGVIRADDLDTLVAAAGWADQIARAAGDRGDGKVVVEAFVPGPEVAVEAVVRAGKLDVLAIFDKPDPLDGPFFEETLLVTPSRLPAPVRAAVVATVDGACRALGLDHGPVHAELRVPGGRPQVIEVAPRTIGGLCGRTVELATGQPLEVVVLAAALGIDVPAGRRHRAAGVLMVPAPCRGQLRAVTGVDDARSVPGVTSVAITAPPGAWVAPAPEGDRYLGFVFAAGLTPAEVEAALRSARRALVVEVDPDGRLGPDGRGHRSHRAGAAGPATPLP
jgi:biotin carboxylase